MFYNLQLPDLLQNALLLLPVFSAQLVFLSHDNVDHHLDVFQDNTPSTEFKGPLQPFLHKLVVSPEKEIIVNFFF